MDGNVERPAAWKRGRSTCLGPWVRGPGGAASRPAEASRGPDHVGHPTLAGAYAGNVMKGAKPSDLPVEQPTKFELLVNLKAAKALGPSILPALLLRADRIIG